MEDFTTLLLVGSWTRRTNALISSRTPSSGLTETKLCFSNAMQALHARALLEVKQGNSKEAGLILGRATSISPRDAGIWRAIGM